MKIIIINKLFKPNALYMYNRMIKYIVLHNTHNGCYDFQYHEDEKARLRLTSITINPPKIF